MCRWPYAVGIPKSKMRTASTDTPSLPAAETASMEGPRYRSVGREENLRGGIEETSAPHGAGVRPHAGIPPELRGELFDLANDVTGLRGGVPAALFQLIEQRHLNGFFDSSHA